LCIAETKINSNPFSLQEKFRSIHPEIFQHSACKLSQTPDNFVNQYQPGGTLDLGRWSFFILHGKNTKKVAIITAYGGLSDLARPMISMMQQFWKLSTKTINKENHDRPKPRRKFILDL